MHPATNDVFPGSEFRRRQKSEKKLEQPKPKHFLDRPFFEIDPKFISRAARITSRHVLESGSVLIGIEDAPKLSSVVARFLGFNRPSSTDWTWAESKDRFLHLASNCCTLGSGFTSVGFGVLGAVAFSGGNYFTWASSSLAAALSAYIARNSILYSRHVSERRQARVNEIYK